jgi:hypothetical protein
MRERRTARRTEGVTQRQANALTTSWNRLSVEPGRSVSRQVRFFAAYHAARLRHVDPEVDANAAARVYANPERAPGEPAASQR